MGEPIAGYAALALAGLAVLAVWVLASKWLCEKTAPDYFTWFLLHFGIGVVGIAAVVALALFGNLSSAAAAILSSIVAYSMGATTHGAITAITAAKGQKDPPQNAGGGQPPSA